MRTTILLVWLLIIATLVKVSPRKSSVFSESEGEIDFEGDLLENGVTDGQDDTVDKFGDVDSEFGAGSLDDIGIVFEPPQLEFVGTHALLPAVLDFSIHNRNPSKMAEPITIHSVVTNNTQFHTVTFQTQTLYYQDSLIVHIMFLPYFVDKVETDLLISTSAGDLSYHIIGNAVANPYHLHPFIGYRIPAGELVYEQPITVFNPHDEVLNIREIFTTESFLSLHPAKNSIGASTDTLGSNKPGKKSPSSSSTSQSGTDDSGSSGSGSGSGTGSTSSGSSSTDSLSAWIVPPGVEKEVMLLSMSAKLPGTYNGYVHIVCDKAKFVVPVELIALEGGVRLEPATIDFGVLTEENEVRSQDVFIVNSGLNPVRVLDMVTDYPDAQLHMTR